MAIEIFRVTNFTYTLSKYVTFNKNAVKYSDSLFSDFTQTTSGE
mgnify:CR=1 FL=1